jgi:hypothetical protein
MLLRFRSATAPCAAPLPSLPPPEEANPVDAVLLAEYDPARSAAWAGAAPPLWTAPAAQLDLWARSAQAVAATEEREGSPFRARGFLVRPVAGPGAARVLDEFCTRTHRTLTGRGMNGRAYGLYDPGGHLVGVANFAPPSNHRTAEGMQVRAPGDGDLSLPARAQVTYTQRELLDCVRLCVAEQTPSGVPLGTGAESFLYAACLRTFLDENRTLWRAIRMAELGLPLPRPEARLLARGASFVRVVRSFAETAVGVGSPYAATGAWYLGTTRVETVWDGRRSGESITRRSLAKLRSAGDGHVHQVLRAAWEGSAGVAIARDAATGATLAAYPLDEVRAAVPDGLSPAARERALAGAWRRLAAAWSKQLTGPVRWDLRADTSGYEPRSSSPKHRYATFLANRPYYVLELARRCRYLRSSILQAEAVWYSEAARWPRGIGFGWPRPPQALRRPEYPRLPPVPPHRDDFGDIRAWCGPTCGGWEGCAGPGDPVGG